LWKIPLLGLAGQHEDDFTGMPSNVQAFKFLRCPPEELRLTHGRRVPFLVGAGVGNMLKLAEVGLPGAGVEERRCLQRIPNQGTFSNGGSDATHTRIAKPL